MIGIVMNDEDKDDNGDINRDLVFVRDGESPLVMSLIFKFDRHGFEIFAT